MYVLLLSIFCKGKLIIYEVYVSPPPLLGHAVGLKTLIIFNALNFENIIESSNTKCSLVCLESEA